MDISLKFLGLNDKATKIYLTLLSKGPMGMDELSTVLTFYGEWHSPLQDLEDAGLIVQNDQYLNHDFQAVKPEVFLSSLTEEKKRLEIVEKGFRPLLSPIRNYVKKEKEESKRKEEVERDSYQTQIEESEEREKEMMSMVQGLEEEVRQLENTSFKDYRVVLSLKGGTLINISDVPEGDAIALPVGSMGLGVTNGIYVDGSVIVNPVAPDERYGFGGLTLGVGVLGDNMNGKWTVEVLLDEKDPRYQIIHALIEYHREELEEYGRLEYS